MQQNVKVYHCNDKERCERFLLNTDEMIISHEEGRWLGSGMYFWDNLSNAKYWYSNKKKDSKTEEFKILKGNLIIENMLDLTDLDICKSVSLLWDFLKNKLIKDHPELENSLNKAESGKKLNLIFLHIETYKLNYEVIKCAARYPKTPKSNLFEYHFDGNKNNFCEVTTENKIIYNAKTEKCLFEFSEEIIEV